MRSRSKFRHRGPKRCRGQLYDELVERCNLYLEAGADMAMPMVSLLSRNLSPDQQMALLTRLASAIEGKVMTSGLGPPHGYTSKDIGQAGYSFIMYAELPLWRCECHVRGIRGDAPDRRQPAPEGQKPVKFQTLPQLFQALQLDKYLRIEQITA